MIDTNVLVSALIGRGAPRALVDAAFDGWWRMVVSPSLLDELEDVLRRPRFARIRREDIVTFVAAVRTHADVVADPTDAPDPVTSDPDDDYLIALARAAGADLLVSGDTDLTALSTLVPRVVTPAALLAEVRRGR